MSAALALLWNACSVSRGMLARFAAEWPLDLRGICNPTLLAMSVARGWVPMLDGSASWSKNPPRAGVLAILYMWSVFSTRDRKTG
ncbi:hypothetical protein OKW41_004465 [Paraburkholderia sp. UCT70]|uniref:hypothetical protein n=1 Tax=Paraburkholderia sp. UCT70 TaxID=2991068 RepID=UPI003D19EEBD